MEEHVQARPHLRLLGGFDLAVDGHSLPIASSGRRLFAFLGVRVRLNPSNRSVIPRMLIAGTLWPDSVDDRALANLRCTIWRLPPAARDLVDNQLSGLSLSSPVLVDVDEMVGRARTLLSMAATPVALSSHAFGHDLLPSWSDEWVLLERERLRQLRLHALEALAARFCREGRIAEAVEAATTAFSSEPLRESAVRVLIDAHLAAGNAAEARRAFDRHAGHLRLELGIKPSVQLCNLIAAATCQ
jgi:DNA-binding SARP family transcriptional activator